MIAPCATARDSNVKEEWPNVSRTVLLPRHLFRVFSGVVRVFCHEGGAAMSGIYCDTCDGEGEILVGYGPVSVVEMCPECDGHGAKRCSEPRCPELATHVATERGQEYPLCTEHLIVWLRDMEVA